MAVDLDEALDELDTADYAAFSKARDSAPPEETEDDKETPAAGDKKPTSESEDADEAEAETGQTETDSETVEEQQEEEDDEKELQGKPGKGNPKRGIDRRFGKLTGKIAALESRLAELGEKPVEDAEEAEEEVASSTEKATEDKAETLVRPMLKDFEDTDTESAWDQYEKAMDAYHDAKYDQRLERKLAEQKAKLDLEHATATADADWSKAAARFPDFNEVVVNDKVQISAAMETAMRMDPESGTALAYYLGQHPEESLRIAKLTLATNEKEWQVALSRAGMELGMIRVKLPVPGAKKDPAKADDKPKPTAAPPPTTKKVTSASKPPTVIRGGTAPPQTDVMDEDGAADYKKWSRAREAQLKRK